METRYDASMDGVALSSISDSIYVLDISESAPQMDIHTAAKPGGVGSFVLGVTREALTVSVSFAVREYDTKARKQIMSRVAKWCSGKYLTVSDRPLQRLQVVCQTPPTAFSALSWTDTVTAVFAAYALPYWESMETVRAEASGDSGSVTLSPSGTAPECVLQAVLTNDGDGTLNTVSISLLGTSMVFEGLGIAPGASMSMELDGGVLRYPAGCLTEDSADEIMLRQGGSNTVTFSADQTVSATFYAREVWL